MYEANGSDLTSSEFFMLQKLVASSDPARTAEEELSRNPKASRELLSGLARAGLIVGTPNLTGFQFVSLTERGRAFVSDYWGEEFRRARELREERAHDYKVAVRGALAGAVFGAVAGGVTGWLMAFIRAALGL